MKPSFFLRGVVVYTSVGFMLHFINLFIKWSVHRKKKKLHDIPFCPLLLILISRKHEKSVHKTKVSIFGGATNTESEEGREGERGRENAQSHIAN